MSEINFNRMARGALETSIVTNSELARLRAIETATRALFTGARKFMTDGDQEQWDAYDLLKAEFSDSKTGETHGNKGG